MKTKKVVTIGGGTGSFMLLSGLKKYPVEISAIVSMADDGGSTGRLRDELGVLPPGDVRQCLVALSESSEELRELMNYRFENGALRGHNFGNLFLSALEKINNNFALGVKEAAKILNIKGEVIPVSGGNMRLNIRLNNGRILKGEDNLDNNIEVRKRGIANVFLKPRVKANRQALIKIRSADFIIIGPGDLYGSIIANLLVGGVAKAIKNSKAEVVFNCNLTNKKGQTSNFKVSDYVEHVEKHIGAGRVNYVVVNNKNLPRDLVKRYERKEGRGSIVLPNGEDKIKQAYKIVRADLLKAEKVLSKKRDQLSSARSFIRHDSSKLTRVIMRIINKKK